MQRPVEWNPEKVIVLFDPPAGKYTRHFRDLSATKVDVCYYRYSVHSDRVSIFDKPRLITILFDKPEKATVSIFDKPTVFYAVNALLTLRSSASMLSSF